MNEHDEPTVTVPTRLVREALRALWRYNASHKADERDERVVRELSRAIAEADVALPREP